MREVAERVIKSHRGSLQVAERSYITTIDLGLVFVRVLVAG